MTTTEIIERLILTREHTLSVKRIEVVLTAGSMGNPQISVGTLPYYDWDKVKEMTYVITYGRYLSCELLVYDKQIKKDPDYKIVKGKAAAEKYLRQLIDGITKQKAVL